MRMFKDERYEGEQAIVTEDMLLWEFEQSETSLEITFEEYIKNCIDKNGTLTEVK